MGGDLHQHINADGTISEIIGRRVDCASTWCKRAEIGKPKVYRDEKCPRCDGAGNVGWHECWLCDGLGRVMRPAGYAS